MSDTIGFPERFRATLGDLEFGQGEGPILVAVSGGLDSCVLLRAESPQT